MNTARDNAMKLKPNILAVVFSIVAVWTGVANGSDFERARPDAQWPQFRGVGASGVAAYGSFPVHFGPASNVVWKTALTAGHSSPCIWGRRLFLTAFNDGRLETICLDRRDGRILWRQSLRPGKMEQSSRLSNPAASTPTTDGQRVFVYFGSFGLLCYDFHGLERWRRPLPTPVTQHGASSSPAVCGERLLIVCDQDVDSYLLAVNARTGSDLWRAERPGFRRGFSTPLLWPSDDPEVAVVAGTLRLVAYDLCDGRERWSVGGLPNEMVASPVAGDGLIFVAGWTPGAGVSRLADYDSLLAQGDATKDGKLTRDEAPTGPAKQHFLYIDANKDGFVTREEWDSIAKIYESSKNALLAIRPGGSGDVTSTHVVWTEKRGLPYVPSPLCYDGRVYLVKNGGLASCFDAKTGRINYQEERLGALGDYYSSPVAAGGNICVASQPGTVVVYEAGDSLKVLARNALGEPILATPAIVDYRLYVRTEKHLYCFAENAAEIRFGSYR